MIVFLSFVRMPKWLSDSGELARFFSEAQRASASSLSRYTFAEDLNMLFCKRPMVGRSRARLFSRARLGPCFLQMNHSFLLTDFRWMEGPGAAG